MNRKAPLLPFPDLVINTQSSATLAYYRKYWNEYELAASAANMDPWHPDREWLFTWAAAYLERTSLARFRYLCSSARFHFAEHGVPDPFADPQLRCRFPELRLTPLAPPYDDTGLAASTKRKYSTHLNNYMRGAIGAGVDPLRPSIEWLYKWLLEYAHRCSLTSAREAVAVLTRYFHAHRVPNVIADPQVAELLATPSVLARDPLSAQWSCDGDIAFSIWRRARYYGQHRFAPGTLKNHARFLGRYEVFARAHGFEPTNPSVENIVAYLVWASEHVRGTSAEHMAKALDHYLAALGRETLMKHPDVRQVRKGIRREKPARPPTPATIDELRQLLSGLSETAPLHIRLRVFLLLCFFGGVERRHVPHLDRSRIEFLHDHVALETTHERRRKIYVGAVDEDPLDIRRWMRTWRSIIGTDPGPLFPAFTPLGEWSSEPLNFHAIYKQVHQLCLQTGVPPDKILKRLRKGFIIAATRERGGVAVMEHYGFSTIDSVKVHATFLRKHQHRRNRPDRRHKRYNDLHS